MISQMKSLEDENRWLERMFAYLSMPADLLKEALEKSNWAIPCPAVVCRSFLQNDWQTMRGAASRDGCQRSGALRCQYRVRPLS